MQTRTPGVNSFAAYACSRRICQLESSLTLKEKHFNGQLRYAYVTNISLKNSSVKWTFFRVWKANVCQKRQNTNILFPSCNDVDGRINIINI